MSRILAFPEVDGVMGELAFVGRVVPVGGVGSGFAGRAINNTRMAANPWAAGEGLARLAQDAGIAAGAVQETRASAPVRMQAGTGADDSAAPNRVEQKTEKEIQ